MKNLNLSKRVKESKENPKVFPIKDPEFFINYLENYRNVQNLNHIKTIDYLFSGESNFGHGGELQSVLALTFLFSPEMIEPYLKKGVKFVVVSDCQKETLHSSIETPQSNLKLIFPKRSFGNNAPSSFHPKLYILKFKNFIRIIIGSGNLLMCDWTRYANVFWKKEFPIMSQGQEDNPNPFASYLSSFLIKAMNPFFSETEAFLGINFKNYKIDETQVHLIGSIPGSVKSDDSLKLSFYQGMKIIKASPPSVPFKLESTKIFYVTSSLGSLNFKLLYDFSKMIFSEPAFNWEKATQNKEKLTDMFNVIYPSANYISGSYFGESRANCLFLRKMIYESFKFQKSILRAYEGNLNINGNNSVLPHYKIWIATHNGKIDDDTILYIGSHNFTQCAWGKFDKNDEKVEIFNYELGIMLPSKSNSMLMKKSLIESFGVAIPAKKYSEHDRPFFVIED